MSLTTDYKERKDTPIGSGVLDYFPDALAEVARVSKIGNDQHNPGQPLHWAWGKSNDHWDCITRHGMERGTIDTDGARHSAKLAWRALALLQEELVAAGLAEIPRGAKVTPAPALEDVPPVTLEQAIDEAKTELWGGRELFSVPYENCSCSMCEGARVR